MHKIKDRVDLKKVGTVNFLDTFGKTNHLPHVLSSKNSRQQKKVMQLFLLNLIYLLSCPCLEITLVINRPRYFFFLSIFWNFCFFSLFLAGPQEDWDRQQFLSGEAPAKPFIFKWNTKKLKSSWFREGN